MDPLLGSLLLCGFNFAPRGWATCDGQLLSISQNTALFSLLGTTYGGDGRVTFALPDLRGRTPIHMGQGPGLSNYVEGEVGGQESTTILVTQMPAHIHPITVTAQVQVSTTNPTSNEAAGGFLTNTATNFYASSGGGGNLGGVSASGTVGVAGGSQPLPILSPYLVMNYCIAMVGIFPSRN